MAGVCLAPCVGSLALNMAVACFWTTEGCFEGSSAAAAEAREPPRRRLDINPGGRPRAPVGPA